VADYPPALLAVRLGPSVRVRNAARGRHLEREAAKVRIREFLIFAGRLDGADKVARDFVFSLDAIQFVLGQR
jgi:hypothetical protein